jgi:hypothetical protein
MAFIQAILLEDKKVSTQIQEGTLGEADTHKDKHREKHTDIGGVHRKRHKGKEGQVQRNTQAKRCIQTSKGTTRHRAAWIQRWIHRDISQ